jgi:hypothetical protein
MIPSITELSAFGLFYTATFSPQVTTCCDHVLILKVLLVFANGKELIPAFRNRDERNIEMAQSGATRPSKIWRSRNSLDDTVGPVPRLSWHLTHRNIMEFLFAPWSRDGQNAEMAQFSTRCPLWMDG